MDKPCPPRNQASATALIRRRVRSGSRLLPAPLLFDQYLASPLPPLVTGRLYR
jgi:hypothetical protein